MENLGIRQTGDDRLRCILPRPARSLPIRKPYYKPSRSLRDPLKVRSFSVGVARAGASLRQCESPYRAARLRRSGWYRSSANKSRVSQSVMLCRGRSSVATDLPQATIATHGNPTSTHGNHGPGDTLILCRSLETVSLGAAEGFSSDATSTAFPLR